MGATVSAECCHGHNSESGSPEVSVCAIKVVTDLGDTDAEVPVLSKQLATLEQEILVQRQRADKAEQALRDNESAKNHAEAAGMAAALEAERWRQRCAESEGKISCNQVAGAQDGTSGTETPPSTTSSSDKTSRDTDFTPPPSTKQHARCKSEDEHPFILNTLPMVKEVLDESLSPTAASPKVEVSMDDVDDTDDEQSSNAAMADAEEVSQSGILAGRLKEKTVAEQLAGRGFTVKQLLEFYLEHHGEKLDKDTLTRDVVRDIVVPETAQVQRCYMESEFMKARGGPQVAKHLVSHSWEVPFVNTVLNILLDATGWTPEEVAHECLDEDGELQAEKALHKLPPEAMSTTYWLCIFGFNHHTSFCGDCPCRCTRPWTGEKWSKELCADCGLAKQMPCPCASLKLRRGDSAYELDKMADLVKLMDHVVVAVDPKLAALSRLWVLRVIGEALQDIPIRFCLAQGLDEDTAADVRQGNALCRQCEWGEVSFPGERAMLLGQVDSIQGGRKALDEVTDGLIKLHFGSLEILRGERVCERGRRCSASIASCLKSLHDLRIDFRWNANAASIAHIGQREVRFLSNLRKLSLNFCGSRHMQRAPKIEGLGTVPKLEELRLSCAGCMSLTEVAPLKASFVFLKKLRVLEVDLSYCHCLEDIDSLWEALSYLSSLERLALNCSGLAPTQMPKAKAMETGFGGLGRLRELSLRFSDNKQLSALPGLGSLAALKKLQVLTVDISKCPSLADISELSAGLSDLKELRKLTLSLAGCGALAESVERLGSSVQGMQKLQAFDLDLSGQQNLQDTAAIGEHLKALTELQVLRLNLSSSPALRDVSGLAQAMDYLTKLQNLGLLFSCCSSLADVACLGKGLRRLEDLRLLELQFAGCPALEDVRELELGLRPLQRLSALSADFEGSQVSEEEAQAVREAALSRGCVLVRPPSPSTDKGSGDLLRAQHSQRQPEEVQGDEEPLGASA